MRRLVFLIAVAACAHEPGHEMLDAPDTSDTSDNCSGAGGGLPTPSCGMGRCACCVSCSLATGLCMSLEPTFPLGIGACNGQSTGTLTMQVDGTAFVASDVAAVANDYSLNVSATTGTAGVTFMVPAQLGTFDCAAGGAGWFAYDDNGAEYWNRATSPRPACSVTLTTIGGVGEPIEGTFAVSLVGANSLELTAGSFSVVRVAYP